MRLRRRAWLGARLQLPPRRAASAAPGGRARDDRRRAGRRLRGVPIALAAKSLAGAARMGFCGFAARAAGAPSNTLTKTPMAHLRKKEKRVDHAQAMIEGKSLAKSAQLCGVHPTTAFRWRHRFLRAPSDDKPRRLSGIVEADETFILESFKGRWSDLPRKARKRGGTARHPGPYQDNIPVLVARDRRAPRWTPFCRRPTAPRSPPC